MISPIARIASVAVLILGCVLQTSEAGFTTVDLSSYANNNLQTGYNGGNNYPVGGTMLTVGPSPFVISSDQGQANTGGVIQTGVGSSTPLRYDVAVSEFGVSTAYTLMNTIYGVLGATVGAVEFIGSKGDTATFNLVEGTNIRDHFNDGYNNTIAAGTNSVYFGSGGIAAPDRLDEQIYNLPTAFLTETLTDVVLIGEGNNPNGQPFLAALTLSNTSVPEPSGIILAAMGLGLAAMAARRRLARREV